MTTLTKGAFAGLAMIAGAAAVLSQGAWPSSDGPDARDIAHTSGSSRRQPGEASLALAFSAGPLFPQQSAPPRRSQGAAPAASDFWSFRPARDTFRADSLLDLRGLNEPTAGQSGFLGLSSDKNSFVRGDGVPIRFWAVHFDVPPDTSLETLAHRARFLAKRGVNLVRLFEPLPSPGKKPRAAAVDAKKIDRVWRAVAAMKKEGIYTLLAPYWADSMKRVPASWNIEGWPENQVPDGLLFFNPVLQARYKAWLKDWLAPRNPYTGIPLAQDPAVACIQLQNEDSLLWWSTEAIKGKQRELLGNQFGNWAAAKYGTIDAALRDWGKGGLPEDDPSRGVLGIHTVWELTQPRSGDYKKRLDDQLQFLAETMHRFNAETARYLREELGCKQLINAGNWKAADHIRLNDVERWSYTANEVIATNRYYSPVHIGPESGWRINKGDRFQNDSILLNPRALPLNLKQVLGYPMMLTETNWVPPLGFQSEAPFLVAAYQSLTGVDAVFWVATKELEWSNQDRGQGDSPARFKWIIATPAVLGQFPAAALLFRRGDVALGQPVVVEHRSSKQLWERVPPIIAEDESYDPNRDLGDSPKQLNLASGVDPLAFLVGPIEVVYGSDPAKTMIADASRFIDRERKLIRSNTGQIAWDYGRGLCTLDAPKAQGATGFLKPVGPIKLSNVTIRSENQYATILVVALDDKPLAQSGRVLVQVGTRIRPTGWSDHPATFQTKKKATIRGREIDSTGTMPWVVQVTMVTIEVQNSNLTSATLLDINGNAKSTLPVRRNQGTIAVELPRDAMYVVLSTQ